MRYELSDFEWIAIKPMLPNKPRGVPRVNDRRILNGIFWVLRSGAPWRDLPKNYGPYTTCYNRFVRWRRAGVWDQIMDALAAGACPREAAVAIRLAALLLVPAAASAFCFSRKWRHAGCPSSCRGRGSTRRHGLGALDLIQVAHDHGGDQGETNGDGGGQPVTAMVEPVAI
jgi:transposase